MAGLNIKLREEGREAIKSDNGSDYRVFKIDLDFHQASSAIPNINHIF